MFVRVVALLIVLGLVVVSRAWADHHGTPDNPNIAVAERLSESDKAMALKASKLLIGYCRPLRKHWDDLENLRADVADADHIGPPRFAYWRNWHGIDAKGHDQLPCDGEPADLLRGLGHNEGGRHRPEHHL